MAACFSKYVFVKNAGYCFLLVLAAFIWGSTFVAQVEGNTSGPFAFTCFRNIIAAVLLWGFAVALDKFGLNPRRPKDSAEKKKLWKAGLLCGIALAMGTNLQQFGLFLGTSAGKSGFLTTCYIVLVPVLSLFLGKRIGLKIWLCVFLTLAGLYLMCVKEGFSVELSDIVSVLCALAFAIQILLIDKFGHDVDNVRLSGIQCLVASVLSAFPMLFVDMQFSVAGFVGSLECYTHAEAWIPLLYAAVLSSGVAFTLQIVAQNKIRPTLASLLMSLESVFAVLSGWIVLGETLTNKEIIGCTLVFFAVILAQVGKK